MVRMASMEPKAKSMAMTMVPAKGRPGKVMPKAMAMTAPREAPEDTPKVEPSARGFFNRPCMAPPHTEREAPVRATHSTRGRREVSMMGTAVPAGSSLPATAPTMMRTVLPKGTATLPTDTQSTSVTAATRAKPR